MNAAILNHVEHEMGDHDGIADELIQLAGLDPDDEEVREAARSFQLTKLVELAADEVGHEGLMTHVLAEITNQRVLTHIERREMALDLPFDQFTIATVAE